MGSAPAGRQRDLTSEVSTTAEVATPQFLSNPIAGCADALPGALVCSWTDGGRDAAWVHLAGALDLATVSQLEQTLEQPQLEARLVVLDLRELEFIDSCGVLAIVTASNRARAAGRRLVLLRAPSNVDRLFTLTGNADQLEIGEVESPEGALRQRALEELAS